MTFLFTDIVNSVRLWEQAPDAMTEALERHDNVVRDAVASHAGHIFSTGGDAFCAVFSHPAEAVAAAVAGQRRLGAERWPAAATIAVRMGIHTGTAVERDGDYFGTAVNLTARLMAAAHGGQVVLSSATREILAQELWRDVDLVDLGQHRLRGFTMGQRVFGVAASGVAADFPPLRTEGAALGNLPVPVSRLIGRAGEIDEIDQFLRRDDRIVTLTGTGGVGKTRLALAVGSSLRDRFPDGVWWVELAPVGRDSDVAAVIAASVGVNPGGAAVASALALALEGRRLLLIVDNCEHVLDATAAVVDVLVSRCPTVTVLATSRERLGVDGEHVIGVRPLDHDTIRTPAAELLIQRIDDEDLTGAAEHAALLEICSRLDGVPLAIELAAARCRVMGPSEVVARLADRFSLLSDRHRHDRHQSIQAIVEWSYGLLGDRQRRLFDRLSVFVGGFRLEAVEVVCSGDDFDADEVDDLFASLVDKSLVERDARRYRLLETTRQFAAEQLERNGASSVVHAAHAAHFSQFVRRVGLGLQGADEAAWDSWLRADWDNVRAAFRFACDSDDIDTASSIVTELALPGLLRQPEALRWVEETYRKFGAVQHPNQHQLVGAAACAAWAWGDDECVSRAVLSARLAADVETAPHYLPEWARVLAAAYAGKTDQVVDLCATTAAHARVAGHHWNEALWLTNEATMLLFGGRLDDAIGPARAAERPAWASGSPSAMAQTLFCLGTALTATDTPRSVEHLERAHDMGAAVGNRFVRNEAFRVLGPLRARLLEPEAALATLIDVADDYLRDGYRFHLGQTLAAVPTVLLRLNRVGDAAILLGAARATPTAANRNFQASLDRVERAVVGQLGAERAAVLADWGRNLTPAAIIAVIRGDGIGTTLTP